MVGYLYAIKAGRCVKLGYSTNPLHRMVKIQSDNHERCVLLGVVPATQDQEAELHGLLAPWRVSGEWFDYAAAPVAALCKMLPPLVTKAEVERIRVDDLRSHTDVIRAFGGPTMFAATFGLPVASAGAMSNRASIAPWHWPMIVRKAAEIGRPDITVEKLASLVAKRGSAASARQIEHV